MPLVNRQDTQLAENAYASSRWVELYDPPVDGRTPLDGEGNPRTSVIPLTSKAAKLAQGFTETPVGGEGPKVGEPSDDPLRVKRGKK